MGSLRSSEWRKLPVSLAELCIDTTLRCGQSFRWRKLNDEWTCALRGRIVSLKQDESHLHYKTTWPSLKGQPLLTPPRSTTPSTIGAEDIDEGDDTESLLRAYFNLDVNLSALYAQWSHADSNFQKRAPRFTGVRILRQDAWEALVGFICSSCNNIPRIMQMVDKLCLGFGPLINCVHGHPFHDFPTAEMLCGDDVESRLRELGFGYRAKYLAQTAKLITTEKPLGWLENLSNPEGREPADLKDVKPEGRELSDSKDVKPKGRDGYREAHSELLKLQGVGPKVADCVCLMGLGWRESVPVDTHVWQIAQRDYKFGTGKHKSLTKATYDAIGDHFRKLWGKEAGWAHSVLFAADLKTFSERLVTKVEVDSEEVKIKAEDMTAEISIMSTSRIVVKREPAAEENGVEEKEIKEETPRSQRAKRRRFM